MKFYFAPMEGVVGHVHRNAHRAYFEHIDKYFAPFIVADQGKKFSTKDMADITLKNNKNLNLVPQILSNNAQDFNHTAQKISQLGYTEINLNLGCPSKKVVSRNRGSGFLAHKEALKFFLDEIYQNPPAEISVKTRLGKTHPDEFYELIEIFNQFPMKELIIHPRIQTDLYRNKPNLKVFSDALKLSKNPICYNGDIFTVRDYHIFLNAFPEVDTIMLGRGLLTNPDLVNQILNQTKLSKETIMAFHNHIYRGYRCALIEERKVLSKMKETWNYLIQIFSDYTTHLVAIRKSFSLKEYESAVNRLFEEQDIMDSVGYSQS